MSDTTGFQPRNTPAERRAFFDVQRQLTELKAQLDTLTTRADATDTQLADHETRIDVLEP